MNSVANGKIRRATRRSTRSTSSRRRATTARRSARRTGSGTRCSSSRATFVMQHGYWGPSFGADDDRARRSTRAPTSFEQRGCATSARSTTKPTLCEWTAERIADGQVVGWFQGRMEWGARALGNRSILADPAARRHARDHQHEDQVPREVPAVRAVGARGGARRRTSTGSVPDPFMMQVYPVRAEKRDVIPAVTHVDGSGRLQTVSRDGNPIYWSLIQRVRAAHRRADRAEHVVQRERADRAPAGRGARLLSAHADGRARARQSRDQARGQAARTTRTSRQRRRSSRS